MFLSTGFGYYEKDGKKLHKFHLPKGEHPDPKGYTVVEVFDQESLERIQLDKSQAQLEADTAMAIRNYHKNAVLNKLKAIGILPEEIDALIGK